MTYYFINDKGMIERKIGGDPPASTFVGVGPDGMMRKFENGKIISVIPMPDNPLRDIIEKKNAEILLGVASVSRKRSRKSKPKSRRKCRCK